MRDYGRVRTSFWADEKIRCLNDAAKMLGVYLLSCPHSNAIGCFRLPLGYAAEDLGWEVGQVGVAMRDLIEVGFVHRDAATGWTLLPNYLRHNSIENSKVGKACQRMASQVPPAMPWFGLLLDGLALHADKLDAGWLAELRNKHDTVSEQVRARPDTVSEQTPIPTRIPEPLPEPEPESSDAGASDAGASTAPPDDSGDLGKIMFGKTLAQLIDLTSMDGPKARRLLGSWARDWGKDATIAAIDNAARDPPMGDAVQFIVAVLQKRGSNGRSRQDRDGFGNPFNLATVADRGEAPAADPPARVRR